MTRRVLYLLLTITCFLLCIVIVKLFSNNFFIRGLIGDFLIVILIYFLVKCFYDIKSLLLAPVVLMLAYFTEFLQYLKFIKYLGLEDNGLAKIIIGTTFDLNDLIAYTLGVVFVFLIDTLLIKSLINDY